MNSTPHAASIAENSLAAAIEIRCPFNSAPDYTSQSKLGFLANTRPSIRSTSVSATSLFFLCLLLRLFETHPWCATVLVDDLDARVLKARVITSRVARRGSLV